MHSSTIIIQKYDPEGIHPLFKVDQVYVFYYYNPCLMSKKMEKKLCIHPVNIKTHEVVFTIKAFMGI